MNVELLSITEFFNIPDWVRESGFSPDAMTPSTLIELAGRNCYQSWNNPSGRTNSEYIRNLIDQGHLSVLEHASAAFLVTGVSRSFTHELVRHRHLSFSQLSQRYFDERECEFIIPPIIRGNERLEKIILEVCLKCREAYRQIVEQLDEELIKNSSMSKLERRKRAREAARAVLPNATETRIVVSGNFRAWREMLIKRLNPAADMEFQEFAARVAGLLRERCPEVFGDLIDNGLK